MNKSHASMELSDEERELLLEDAREQVEARYNRPPEDPYDYDYGEWGDPRAEQERATWLASFLWADPPDPQARVVNLPGSLVAVYESREWRIENIASGRTSYPPFRFSPDGYSDAQLVKKLQICILFA